MCESSYENTWNDTQNTLNGKNRGKKVDENYYFSFNMLYVFLYCLAIYYLSASLSLSLFLLWVCSQSVKSLSHVRLFVTQWTIAHQAPLSMGFSRQEYWSVLPCPPPGDLPKPGIKPRSLALQVDSLLSEPLGKPKNTGVASLFLFQAFFLTYKSNQGLLHCHQILYQLSYQRSPLIIY